MIEPDFKGEPPDYWWSDLDPPDLLAEIGEVLSSVGDVVEAWTEESEGPAFAKLADGRTLKIVGDGTTIVWQEVEAP